jgi:hypothetical protein
MNGGAPNWFHAPVTLAGETTVRMTQVSPVPKDVLSCIATGFSILTP